MPKRILLTGMSGTGKSTVLSALARRGYDAVDTDDPGWKAGADPGAPWDERRIADLLDAPRSRTLVVSGCVENQGKFYGRFDHVILLRAPAEVILGRIAARTNHPFGKSEAERAAVLRDLETVEPLLRRTATHEVDAGRPLESVVAQVLGIIEG